ncbi:MAG: serine protease [Planctomycetaceae bacterium]|nr:serine protease [Planctomycetaceae bacterium]
MRRRHLLAFAGVFFVLGAGAGALWVASGSPTELTQRAAAQSAATSPLQSVSATPRPLTAEPAPVDLTPQEMRNIRVYETANHSVVNIDTRTVRRDPFFMTTQAAEGSGSGAIIDRQGHIITNYHVVDGAQEMQVTLASNSVYPAVLVGHDKENDIAILRIDAPADELFPIEMGDSAPLRVGQSVYALGNPFGWDGTLTSGIISSLNRNLPSRIPGRQMQALIQTDAAMNPGNSGGPLLDSNARMVGMCVAIATRTGENTGVGFAIPIDRIKQILPQLIEHGRIIKADIGITHVMETQSGLVVAQVAEGGPADKAGIRGFEIRVERRQQGPIVYESRSVDRAAADRIVAINGKPMRTGVQFRDTIWEYKPGDTVTLTLIRNGQQVDVPVTLAGN